MNKNIIVFFFSFHCLCLQAQKNVNNWYSEYSSNDITIQNSFPKGGPYTGFVGEYLNPSYLVFFTRVINDSNQTIELEMSFSADSIIIPNSADAFMKLFLPSKNMSLEKVDSFSYGITELESLNQSTHLKKTIPPSTEDLFYIVAFFYQSKTRSWIQEKGGNRAEILLEGQNLIFNMPPQVDRLPCGKLIFK